MEPDQTAPCLQKESKLDLAIMFRGIVYSTLSYTYSCVAYIILKYKDILFRWLSYSFASAYKIQKYKKIGDAQTESSKG